MRMSDVSTRIVSVPLERPIRTRGETPGFARRCGCRYASALACATAIPTWQDGQRQ